MPHRDYSGLANGGMAHESVFQVDGADPLASRFHAVFAAIYQLDTAVGIDCGNVAGSEPAVSGPSIFGFRGVEIAAGHPWAAYFKFSHGLAIPVRRTALRFHAYFHKRQRPAL